MPAQFLVTIPPGAPIPNVGFVRPSEIFTAPKGYVPSYTMKPVNDEAVAALRKVQASMRARAKDLRASIGELDEPSDKKAAKAAAKLFDDNAASISLTPIVIPKEEPQIEQGLTMEQLAAQSAGGQEPHGGEQPSSGRTADRG
jgi:hypothetical protein